MQLPENQPLRRLRVVLLYRGEPLEDRSFRLEEPHLLGRRPTRVTLGQEGRDTFALPPMGLPPAFPLLRAVGDEFVLRLSRSMVGRLSISGESMTVAEFFASRRGVTVPGETVPQRDQVLGPDDWGVVTADRDGSIAFFFQFLPALTEVTDLRPRGRLPGVPLLRDPFLRQALGISAVVHLAVLLLARMAWDPVPTLALDASQAARIVRLTEDTRAVERAAPPAPSSGFQGIAAQLLRERDRQRSARRPLLSDDDAASPAVEAPQRQPPPGPAATPASQAPAEQAHPPAPALPPGAAPTDKAAPAAPASRAPAIAPAPDDNAAPAPAAAARPADKAPPPAPDEKPAPKAPPVSKAPAAKAPAARAPAVARAAPSPGPGASLTAQAGGRPAVVAAPGPAVAPPRPVNVRVLSGAPKAQGGLNPTQLDKVITFHQAEIESCYRRDVSMGGGPPPGGRVVLVWTIDASGKVTEARIESTSLNSPIIERCIVQRVLQWRFPPAAAATPNATIPFIFRTS